MTSDEALKELNSGASPATLCMRLIASLSECEKARDAAVQELGLERMNGDVISQIRAELKERYGEECTFFDDAVRHVCVTLEKRAEKAEAEFAALRVSPRSEGNALRKVAEDVLAILETGVDPGPHDMNTLDGRAAWIDRMTPVRERLRAALARFPVAEQGEKP